MQYTYDTYIKKQNVPEPVRIDTTTNFEEAHKLFQYHERLGNYLFTKVSDNSKIAEFWSLNDNDDWEDWRIKLERVFSWKPEQEVRVEKACDHSISMAAGLAWCDSCGAPLHEKQSVDDFVEKAFDIHTKHNDPKHSPTANSNQHVRTIGLNPIINAPYGTTPIDPPHYQNYVDDYQWMETMCRIPRYRDHPNEFIAALEMQVRKYLDRAGRKDEDLQELQKGLWYYKFMVAYIKNGCTPILVKDVEDILSIGRG